MEINGRRKKSKSICFVVGEVIEINGSLCRSSWKSVEEDGKSMGVGGSRYGSSWKSMEAGGRGKSIEVSSRYGSIWR